MPGRSPRRGAASPHRGAQGLSRKPEYLLKETCYYYQAWQTAKADLEREKKLSRESGGAGNPDVLRALAADAADKEKGFHSFKKGYEKTAGKKFNPKLCK